MTDYPDHEVRLQRRYRALGTDRPVCVTCGETNPFCLELHHIGERKHHDDLSIVCRNCHRKLTDPQKDRITVSAADSRDETIGRYLCGLADLLAMVAATLREFGERLLGFKASDKGGAS